MRLTVEIVSATPPGPPDGVPVIVQLRDAALADASSVTLAEARVTTRAEGDVLARAQLVFDGETRHLIVWVHVDCDGSGDVSVGDYITMQSYSVRGGGVMRVDVKRV
jgi:hypothetical protein